MKPDKLQDYIFSPSPKDQSIWTRKCYGLESFVSIASENLDGIPFVTASVAVKPTCDREILEPAIRTAWIALRHSLPAIAAKSSLAPDSRFVLTYHVPKNIEQAQIWAYETLFFNNEVEDGYETHKKLKDERVWSPANGHWVGELHVSRIEDGWMFSVVFTHNSTDGRSVLGVLNELLAKLVSILEGSAKPISELRWGKETKRLPPAAIVILEKANIYPKKDHSPLPLSQPLVQLKSTWTWPPVKVSSPIVRDVSTFITLPVETTSKLHAITKLQGRTITSVITAISILAHAEISFTTAAKAGRERFKTVSESYKVSEVYEVAFALREKLPRPYNSLTSETSSPLAAIGAMPLFLPMDVVRKFFKIEDSTASVSSTDLSDVFWNGLVDAAAKSWKDRDYDMTLHGYAGHEEELEQVAHNFDPNFFHTPGLIVSSLGDFSRLNLFNDYLPSQRNKTLTVVSVTGGQRMRVPAIMNIFWQYDGKLSCQWASGGEWMTEEEMQQLKDSFMRWIRIFVDSVDLENLAVIQRCKQAPHSKM